MPPPAELYSSPDHYLHSFEGDAAVFVTMDQAAYRRSIFLDARIAPANPEPLLVPLDGLLAQVPPPRPLAWIFHVAHCGSTLLARALEALDGTRLVLREPLALRQVALEPDPVRLGLVRTMLGKRYPGGGATLVKANVPVNFILPELGAADQDARAIFLSLGLRDYCLAILRSEQHRAWLRHVTGLLGAWLDPFDPSSDGQAAAALWLAQISRFAAALEAMPNARSLDGERFLQSPVDSVARAAVALGMAADDGAVARLAESPLFTTYSKRPGLAFDNGARLARRRSDEAALEADIGAAEAWIVRHPSAADAALATLESRAL